MKFKRRFSLLIIAVSAVLTIGYTPCEEEAEAKPSASGRYRFLTAIFSADQTADAGIDLATPVVERIGAEAKSKFNGSIQKLMIKN